MYCTLDSIPYYSVMSHLEFYVVLAHRAREPATVVGNGRSLFDVYDLYANLDSARDIKCFLA